VNATFRLQVEDRDGTRSTNTASRSVRIYVNGRCGFDND
jgi:hypothetical protein